jgi:hypothetical protein
LPGVEFLLRAFEDRRQRRASSLATTTQQI